MYTVIVCPNCENVKLVKDRPETTKCGRCQKRHKFNELKHFHQSDDAEEARQARVIVLAQVNDREVDYERLSNEGVFNRDIEKAIDSEEFLRAKGIDVEELDAYEEQVESGSGSGSKSQREIVEDALKTLEMPSEEEVVEYATERGVPREKVEDALTKLKHQGRLVEATDGLRLV